MKPFHDLAKRMQNFLKDEASDAPWDRPEGQSWLSNAEPATPSRSLRKPIPSPSWAIGEICRRI